MNTIASYGDGNMDEWKNEKRKKNSIRKLMIQ